VLRGTGDLTDVLSPLKGEERQEMDLFLEAPRDRAADNSLFWSIRLPVRH